jgi:hypothetical protein
VGSAGWVYLKKQTEGNTYSAVKGIEVSLGIIFAATAGDFLALVLVIEIGAALESLSLVLAVTAATVTASMAASVAISAMALRIVIASTVVTSTTLDHHAALFVPSVSIITVVSPIPAIIVVITPAAVSKLTVLAVLLVALL